MSAVDGQAEGFSSAHPDITLSAPEYACYLSHRNVWKMICESDDEFGVVMEDDMVLAASFKMVISHKEFYASQDILRLETWPYRSWVDKKPTYEFGGIASRIAYHSPLGTGCYIISKQYAKRLLSEVDTLSTPIDKFLFHHDFGTVPPGRIRQLDPAPAIQSCFYGKNAVGSRDGSDIYDACEARVAERDRNLSPSQRLTSFLDRTTLKFRRSIYRLFFPTRVTRRIPFDDRL